MTVNKRKEQLQRLITPLKTLKPAAKPAERQPLAPRALLQRGAGNAAIQRAVIQRKAADGGTPGSRAVDNALRAPGGKSLPTRLPDSVQSALASGGRPLELASRAFFEPRFAADLSGVSLHTDEQAHRAAQDIQANAFTYGQDIYFSHGRYQPGTQAGDRLMAHELAHTLQQKNGVGCRPAG